MHGRLSPFIELGVGFNPELTARDNVIINAIMLGLTRKQARERFDEIIEFAELEEFVDLKLKNYSSGMSVRLGFSVAIQVDADVLLVDEVLAVGDAAFQPKCFDEFDRHEGGGPHDPVRHPRHGHRRALLRPRPAASSAGRSCDIGRPSEIIAALRRAQLRPRRRGRRASGGRAARGARILRRLVRGRDAASASLSLEQGRACRACFEVEFDEHVEDPLFAITFRNDVRHTIFVATQRRARAARALRGAASA